jgi:transposase
LQEALRHLGLLTGGQTGADLGSELGISGSRDTILRLVRQAEQPARQEPRVIGLDDWAWKRRLRYGTLICDLEQGLPVDLLADRTVETVSAWLQNHPRIEIVSRDGSSEYASAIKKGAPQARPRLIDPYKTYLLSRWHQGCHNGSRLERELRAKGYKGSERAIYRYLETLEPSDVSARKRRSVFALEQSTSPRQPNPLLTLSAQQATWLFFRKQEDLKEEERTYLRLLRQASPSVEVTYQLVEIFLQMVRERTGEQLDAWLGTVQASHLNAFQSFVTGVQQDKDAVLAGLTLPWSNGPLEGNVNRLKLIKRSMYGRAEFDLLKLRVLYQSKKNRDRKNKKNINQAQQVSDLKKPKRMKSSTNSQRITTGISKVA